MKTSNLVLLDEQTINPIYLNSDPTLSSNTPPPLGDLSTTTGGIKPIKSNLLLQSDVLPLDSPYAQDSPIKMSCEEQWNRIAMTSRFSSEQAMLDAKKEFITKCKGLGTSVISDPTKDLFPNLPISTPSYASTGGGMGVNENGEALQPINKKPFPYWILIVGAIGAYLIFRKK
jgi:hypothetical protein